MVLVSSEIGTNTADPRIEPALNHVGIVNNGESGVYLGNYQRKSWVLTSNHVGPGSFELGGITYSAHSRDRSAVIPLANEELRIANS